MNSSPAKGPLNVDMHPCFNQEARHTHARIHLPVAPSCNMQCNYCDRKFSCINESRPGVTCAVHKPRQALEYLRRYVEKAPHLSVVGIAGPGDPFACAEETLETLRLVKAEFPHLLLCVATNGLALPPYVKDVAALGVSHVTVTVNAVSPAIGARLYQWMQIDGKRISGVEAATQLWHNQATSITALSALGTIVKVNSIYVPGVNDTHILDVAKRVSVLGAGILNIMALYPTPNTVFASVPEPEKKLIARMRLSASKYLKQMSHCSRCRADAAGLVGAEQTPEQIELLQIAATTPETSIPDALPMSISPHFYLRCTPERPYVAIASRDGLFVNQHLGEATQVRIYKPGERRAVLVDLRSVETEAAGSARWLHMLDRMKDCCGILVSGAGAVPRKIFAHHGVPVGIVEGAIEDALRAAHEGASLQFMLKPGSFSCSSSCAGDAAGCS